MNEEIKKLSQDISESNEIKPHIIDADFINSHSEKAINLLNGGEAVLNNQYYHFKFKEPIYIHRIRFVPKEGVHLSGMEIKSIDFENKESTIKLTKKEHTDALLRIVIKEFKIKPKNTLLNKTKLQKIEVLGFLVSELNSIKEKVEEVGNYKIDLQKKSDKLVQKNQAYSDKEDRIDELNQKIPELQEDEIKLKEEISNLENTRVSLKEDNQTLSDSTAQLKTESESLNKEIPRQKAELKNIIANKNIFSTEMTEYIKQADNHIKIYFVLSLIPWFLITCISYLVFSKTADLSTIYSSFDGEIDIFSIFWTRLPFALITISILFVAYEISKMLIQNMMRIQSQKRVFAKIGIVAKDVADGSILNIEDLTDEDKFNLRTKLKMDLLKSHLSNDIGEKYEYKIKSSLFAHLPELFGKNPKVGEGK
jgi:hypothetical protein